MPVTSVFRRSEKIAAAPASIFVISDEDIRRSGAVTLAEALRLAPNLQVARVDARTYAISARGFNNAIANKLLVLVDGRTVYSPIFSGVFWDQQDVFLEDVDRIEVISGPGATQWGANAVNGVINVITRAAAETHGVQAALAGSRSESLGSVRYGAALGSGDIRLYGKAIRHDRSENAAGTALGDAWQRWQAGFRADWAGPVHSLTVSGEAYDGEARVATPFGTSNFSGANLLARWGLRTTDGSQLTVQGYVDHAERDDIALFRDRMRVYDIEAQYATSRGAHQLLFGGGYRWAKDEAERSLLVAFIPESRDLRWANVFLQDTFEVSRGVSVTAGAKLERNIYTGWEVLPSVRLAWTRNARELVWGALSRAVRAPARLDREFHFPATPPFLINGGPDFESEVATVAELGYRASPTPTTTLSATLFYSDYDKLRSGQPAPAVIQNMIEGEVSGVELWGVYQPAAWVRVTAGLTALDKDLRVKPGSTDPVGPSALGNDPRYQGMLRVSMSLGANVDADVTVRRVGSLPMPAVPGYTAVDARIGWRVARGVELSVGVRNAFDPGHPEFNAPAAASQIPRSAYAHLSWKL